MSTLRNTTLSACRVIALSALPLLSSAAPLQPNGGIALDVRPRVCTLKASEDACETTVRAHWQSQQNESLCLLIVGRSDIKQCWEQFAEGAYEIELSFSHDLTLELRDTRRADVLASAAIKVIREALQFRRKRKQPWNILY